MLLLSALPAVAGAACAPGASEAACGPTRATVANVVDGDTVVLSTGERVRYLLVDAPESTNGSTDCYGPEAAQYNAALVQGREVELGYDVECADRFGRLLAYVRVDGREVNSLLVERGYACVLAIPPNGQDRQDEYYALQARAKAEGRGMWSACEVVACE